MAVSGTPADLITSKRRGGPAEGCQVRYPQDGVSSTHSSQPPRSTAAAASLQSMNLFKRIMRRLTTTWDAGMSTAEYAVGTIAAVSFAAVLYKVVQSSAVHDALSSLIRSALNVSL